MNIFEKREIARDLSTSPEVLTKLAEEGEVSEEVARNPSTPPEVLIQLAEDQETWVRAHVAQNLSTPPEVLAQLAEDENDWVREEVAANLNTSPEILTRLADDDDDEDIRNASSKNLTYLHHRAVQDGVCEAGQQMPAEWLQQMYLTKHVL